MNRLDAALAAVPREDLDEFELARIEAMVTGYTCMWDDVPCEVLGVEHEFQFPLVDHWLLGGKIDLVLRLADGRLAIVDHKTSGEDVSAGSTYRERLILNGQVSQYLWGAETLGWEADVFMIDVLGKPKHKPLGVTKSRTVAETSDEYRRRVLEAMTIEPGAYFAQIEVTRAEAERGEYVRRIHDDAALIDHVRNATLQTPNEDACFKYGQSNGCEFWPVCSSTASLDDPGLYRLRTHKHDELALQVPEGMQLMTNSRRQAFNACRRKHHWSYELGYAARSRAKSLVIGDAVHKALESYWNVRKQEQQSTAAE